MNKENIKSLVVKHVPTVAIEDVELVRASGLTNITYEVRVKG
jgi:predicted Ser/Thr protein kinase